MNAMAPARQIWPTRKLETSSPTRNATSPAARSTFETIKVTRRPTASEK